VKRQLPKAAGPVLAQIREIKSFYGITEQRLESLLLADGDPATPELNQQPIERRSNA
jgi:hypothetical protein